MNTLKEIVSIMNSEDSEGFIAYLEKKNKRTDVRNIKLFNSLKTDDINIQKNIHKDKKSADAYHAVSKRLYDSLIDFMASRSFENDTSDEQEVLRLLVVSRVFFEHKLYKTAFKCLAKAEIKAIAIEHFSLLNEIYHTQVQYAHLTALPLETIMDKFKANKQKMDQEEQLNLGYALLRRELAEIYHKGKVVDFQAFIKDTIESHGISLDEILTFKSLYQILFIANEYASINSNFSLVEPFIEKSFAFINGRENLSGRHLYYHIYVLYFMANIHFRNRRFAESLTYLENMHAQLQLQDRRYYSRFCLRYFLLRSLNDNYSGDPAGAISIAEKALTDHKKADISDINDLRLALAVFYLQANNGRSAAKEMTFFKHSDSWYEKKMGMDWAIRKSLVEIVLHAQNENTELALSRLKSFKRRYKKYLAEVNEDRVMAYATLLERYLNKPETVGSGSFMKSLGTLMASANSENEDIFVVSFLGWLLAKATKKPIYETTLALLGNHFPPFHSE